MKKTLFALAFAVGASGSFAADMTEEQKTIYTLGAIIGKQLSVFDLSPEEVQFVIKGLGDSATGAKMAVEGDVYGPKVQELANTRRALVASKQVAAGKVFAEKAAAEPGAVKTASGLVYISVKDGAGASPATTDTVKANYRGTLADGTEFDSSYKRGQPIDFPLNGVIKCWTEGLQKMKVGGKARLICPPEIAYGEQGAAGAIPPNATLNFDVELLAVTPAAKEAPEDAAPGANK
jgi:FKBP-type peptidyl-prolyl cis-trans isomerase FkpA